MQPIHVTYVIWNSSSQKIVHPCPGMPARPEGWQGVPRKQTKNKHERQKTALKMWQSFSVYEKWEGKIHDLDFLSRLRLLVL